jgi:hypothetical protein
MRKETITPKCTFAGCRIEKRELTQTKFNKNAKRWMPRTTVTWLAFDEITGDYFGSCRTLRGLKRQVALRGPHATA